jgi:hypothetical protein
MAGEDSVFGGWRPPGELLSRDFGRFVVVSNGGRVSTVLELRAGIDRGAVSVWLAGWLAAWGPRSRDWELSVEMTFAYLVLSHPPSSPPDGTVSERGPVREFGYGTSPQAPEEWGVVTLRSLLADAMDELGHHGL